MRHFSKRRKLEGSSQRVGSKMSGLDKYCGFRCCVQLDMDATACGTSLDTMREERGGRRVTHAGRKVVAIKRGAAFGSYAW